MSFNVNWVIAGTFGNVFLGRQAQCLFVNDRWHLHSHFIFMSFSSNSMLTKNNSRICSSVLKNHGLLMKHHGWMLYLPIQTDAWEPLAGNANGNCHLGNLSSCEQVARGRAFSTNPVWRFKRSRSRTLHIHSNDAEVWHQWVTPVVTTVPSADYTQTVSMCE